jgi:hypothetical protein
MSLTITIPGAVNVTTGSTAPAVLTIGVGVPGAAGPQGPAGQGVPAGGTSGQYLQKTSGADYATDWVTLNLSAYLTTSAAASTYQTISGMSDYLAKAGNLAGLASTSTARSNLGLGSLDSPTFAGVTAQGSGANVANLTPTSLSLTHATSGSFTIQPSVGITFPNGSVQTTAFTGIPADYITSVSSPLSVTAGNLSINLSAYLTSATAASTYAVIAAGQPTSGTVGQVLTKNSGTNYDSSWQTLIPGDRYLTSSTTTLTINNSNKTLTVGTGLSYTSQQDIVIAHDAANHMHARVLTYNASTGVMEVDVLTHDGSGTFSTWTVNVGGAPALASVVWGDITGTLGNQTDLATALNGKVNVGSSVFLNHGNAFVVNDGGVYPNQVSLDNTGLDIRDGTTFATVAEFKSSGVIVPSAGITFSDASVQTSAGISAATVASTYATKASPSLTGNVTITSNSSGAALFIEQAGTGNILTLHDQASDTNFVAIDQNGKVNTIPSEATNGAGFNIAHGVAPTTAVNGDIWTTTTGLFMRQNGVTQQYVDLAGTQTINGVKNFTNPNLTFGNSTAAGTINVGTGATISGSTRTINIGTGSAAGSTNAINIGGGSGTITTTLNGTTNFTGPITGAINNITLGNGTAASTFNLFTGATVSGSTKTVAIATGGAAGSTTTITIGGTTGSTTTLQGTTNGVTAAADTNSVALATTAFVAGQAGSATPLVNGTAAVGTSLRYARQDHVHPTDTTRAPLASPALTGTPTAPTATGGTNTTQIATTAFVTAAVPAAATHIQSLQFASTTAFTRVIDASSQLIAPSVLRVWPSPSNFNGTSTSGSGASAVGYLTGYILTSPSAGVAGNARAFHGNIANDLGGMLWGGTGANVINFARRVSMAFRFAQFPSSTASVTRVLLGKIHGAAVGDLTSAGIGVKYVPNGANFDFQLQVHNGTTLTSVTSSTQYAGGVADLEVVSDGAGNAILYLNGAQVASTTGAPTAQTAASATVFAEIESTASTANQPSATIGRLYVNSLNF